MCWSAKVSLNTFLFAVFGAIFGYINGFDKKLLIFFSLFSSMQFVEYMLWSHLDNKEINRLWTIIGYIIILSYPYATINFLDKSRIKNIIFILYTLFVLIITLFEYINYDFKTSVGKNGHLSWNWSANPNTLPQIIGWIIWFIAFYVPFIYIAISKKSYLISLIFGILITFATFYYNISYGTFGSMWCWFATLIWLYVIAKCITFC